MNIQQFWSDVLAQRVDEIREYFHATASVNWHCSNEHFTAPEFIRANCEYNGYGVSVGDWDGKVEKIVTADDMIVTVTRCIRKIAPLLFTLRPSSSSKTIRSSLWTSIGQTMAKLQSGDRI